MINQSKKERNIGQIRSKLTDEKSTVDKDKKLKQQRSANCILKFE